MPGGIIEDQDIPFSGVGNTFGCFIKEDLENIRVTVAGFNRKEFSGTGTDCPENAQTNVIAIMNNFWSRSLDCPGSSGFRFSFYSRFIPIPELNLRIFNKLFQSLYELFSCFFVLSIRPGFGHLQDIPFVMKKAKDRVVGTFKGILCRDVAMEGRSCPEGSLSLARLLELLYDLLFLFTGNKGFSSGPSLCNQPVSTIVVESFDDLLYGTFRQINCLHHLLSRRADEEHDNDKASTIRLSVASLTHRLEISQRGIFGVGRKIALSHDPYMRTSLVKCLEISTSNGNYF